MIKTHVLSYEYFLSFTRKEVMDTISLSLCMPMNMLGKYYSFFILFEFVNLPYFGILRLSFVEFGILGPIV